MAYLTTILGSKSTFSENCVSTWVSAFTCICCVVVLCICIFTCKRKLLVLVVHIYCMVCWGGFVLNVIVTRQ